MDSHLLLEVTGTVNPYRHTVYMTQEPVDGSFKHRPSAHLHDDCTTLQRWARNSTQGPTPFAFQATEAESDYPDSTFAHHVGVDGVNDWYVGVCRHCIKRAWKTGEHTHFGRQR